MENSLDDTEENGSCSELGSQDNLTVDTLNFEIEEVSVMSS